MKSLENKSAKIFLKRGREKSVLNRHPWVFSGAVDRIDGVFKPGDIVRLVTSEGKFLAKGFINPRSQIVARIVCFEDQQIDAAFFKERLQNAIDLRKQYIDSNETAYRLVYGEGDQLSGLVVDKYNNNLVIQIFSLGMDRLRGDLVKWLADIPGVNCIIERSEGDSRKYEGLSPQKSVLQGELPEETIILENGLRYKVDIWNGQKTGFYIDQRNNRAMIGKLASERREL